MTDYRAVELNFIAVLGFALVCRFPVQNEAIGFNTSEVDMRVLGNLATEKADEFVKRLMNNKIGTVCEPVGVSTCFCTDDDDGEMKERTSG